MNNAIGTPGYFTDDTRNIRRFFREDDIPPHGASQLYVFIDEHEFTIGSTAFFVIEDRTPANAVWEDLPGARHGGQGALSFADGHCELHRWLEASTMPTTKHLVDSHRVFSGRAQSRLDLASRTNLESRSMVAGTLSSTPGGDANDAKVLRPGPVEERP